MDAETREPIETSRAATRGLDDLCDPCTSADLATALSKSPKTVIYWCQEREHDQIDANRHDSNAVDELVSMSDDATTNGNASTNGLPAIVLDVQGVADWLTVPVATVENLHRVGALRAIKIGKHNRWRRQDVEAFVRDAEPEK